MNGIRVERQDGIVRVILQSGRGNPLTPQVLTELNDTFAELMAAAPGAGGRSGAARTKEALREPRRDFGVCPRSPKPGPSSSTNIICFSTNNTCARV